MSCEVLAAKSNLYDVWTFGGTVKAHNRQCKHVDLLADTAPAWIDGSNWPLTRPPLDNVRTEVFVRGTPDKQLALQTKLTKLLA